MQDHENVRQIVKTSDRKQEGGGCEGEREPHGWTGRRRTQHSPPTPDPMTAYDHLRMTTKYTKDIGHDQDQVRDLRIKDPQVTLGSLSESAIPQLGAGRSAQCFLFFNFLFQLPRPYLSLLFSSSSSFPPGGEEFSGAVWDTRSRTGERGEGRDDQLAGREEEGQG